MGGKSVCRAYVGRRAYYTHFEREDRVGINLPDDLARLAPPKFRDPR